MTRLGPTPAVASRAHKPSLIEIGLRARIRGLERERDAAQEQIWEMRGTLINVAKELNEWHQVVTERLAIKCEPGCRTIGILEQARRAIEKGGIL